MSPSSLVSQPPCPGPRSHHGSASALQRSDPSPHLFIRGSYTSWATGQRVSHLAIAKFCNFSSTCTFPCPFAPNFSRCYPLGAPQGAVTLRVVAVTPFARNSSWKILCFDEEDPEIHQVVEILAKSGFTGCFTAVLLRTSQEKG